MRRSDAALVGIDDVGLARVRTAYESFRDGRPTAYVCRGFVCRLPVTDAEALADQLRAA